MKNKKIYSSVGIVLVAAGAFTFWSKTLKAKPEDSIRATSPEIALGNLDAQITSLHKQIKRLPTYMPFREMLNGLILSKTQYYGNYDDFDIVMQNAEEAVKLAPKDPRAYLLRAGARSAVHLFKDSLADLAIAEKLGAKKNKIEALKATIYLATGENSDQVVDYHSRRLAQHHNYDNLVALGGVEGEMGNAERSDALYSEAITKYGDVSPFPMAWIEFQRGVMWSEKAAQPDKAYDLYKEALKLLPNYVAANVHFAELQWLRGEKQESISRLERISKLTTDPEPEGVLGKYLLEEGRTSEAEQHIAKARRGYEHLLSKYERAFRDHASEFFAGAGHDPQRALQLAKSNLTERKNERAYIVAIRAAMAANDEQAKCSFVSEAEGRHPRQQFLINLIAHEGSSCGTPMAR